jgi:hypothetical protein
MVIDLWNTNMKKAARTLNARAISMLEMNAYTKMGPPTKYTNVKIANERHPEVFPAI